MQWTQVEVQTRNGLQQAMAPVVISASRATDIPAFHAEWFMHRVRAGYCLWENPFNSLQKQYVSFKKCKIFVFWTKNAQPLMPYLDELDALGYQYYFQYTINDYDSEGLERGLPCLHRRLDAFQHLATRIGKHRVIWRFDPIIVSKTLRTEDILERYRAIAMHLAPYTEKNVFSFVDWYKKTAHNLHTIDVSYRALHEEEMHALARGIVKINDQLPQPLTLATCAEGLSLAYVNIAHNACIDSNLLMRLCPNDKDILKVCGQDGASEQLLLHPLPQKKMKNVAQRAHCRCAPSKDIGSYNSCMHFCAYCYANHSVKAVQSKIANVDMYSERI